MVRMDCLLRQGQFANATKYWSFLESVIRSYTFQSNFYNVMEHNLIQDFGQGEIENDMFQYKLGYFYQENLDTLMNTKVRNILSM